MKLRIAMQRIVANLYASGINKDLFVQWVMGACLIMQEVSLVSFT